MTSRVVIQRLREDGWEEIRLRSGSSHKQFRHPTKPGKVTVQDHKGKDIPLETLKSIERQSGLKLR